MNQSNDAIRQANRRALPKFLLIMFCAALVGGTFGYCAASFGLEGVAGALGRAGEFFSLSVAPWLLLGCAVLLPAVCLPLYSSAKKMLTQWDGEDEDVPARAERTLSAATLACNVFMLAAMFLMGASYAAPLLTSEEPSLLGLLGVPVFFIVTMLECLLLQQWVVDLTKRLNPEKTASVYDLKFQKKWYDSCDEAEKLLIGQCAYKAFLAMSRVCGALWLVFTLSALFLGTGLLPILAVCLIWGTGQIAYSYWTLRLDRPGGLAV